MRNESFGDICWEKNYQNGRYNKYPFDEVVSFIKKNYHKQITILDLGCGGGNNSLFFINEGHKVIAVDGSETSLNLTKSLCLNHENLTCLHNNFTKLTIDDNFVDCVIDRQSMGQNSKENIVKILDEVYRVLKTGGKIQSFLFSDNHPALKENTFDRCGSGYKFKDGMFSQSGFTSFTNIQDLEKLFYKFNILDIRLITTYSYTKKCGIDEYFIIEAEKAI